VDIHTGSQKRTNLPQLRADMNNPDVAAFTLGFDRMAVVHSSGSPGMLRTAAVNAGIRAVTLEAGDFTPTASLTTPTVRGWERAWKLQKAVTISSTTMVKPPPHHSS